MYANSWLYHYYTVQSKIQFGIPYEGPARVQTNNDSYLQQQQQQQQEQQQQQPEQNDLHNHNNHTHHHHHHHSFHHYSPNSLQTPLTHSYLTHSHMSSYGYHSPVAQHQSSPGLVNHYGNSTPHLSYHGSNDGYRPYAYRIDPILPVDYSGHVSPMTNHNTNSSNGSVKSTNQSNSESGSPPAKRRAVNRLEPLFIPEHQQETSSDETLHSEPVYQTTTSDGGTVLLTTVVPGRYSHTHHIKALSNEPTDLIDQWNPSPPWSETTQKVPDIAQQELCYLSRTPPTPTSAPLTSSNGVAFSFDWMPEQFVPIVDATHNNNNNHTVPNGMTHIDAMTMSAAPLSTSPNEHKFYNLDRSPDNSIGKHF